MSGLALNGTRLRAGIIPESGGNRVYIRRRKVSLTTGNQGK